jgi:general secretion pathway protein F
VIEFQYQAYDRKGNRLSGSVMAVSEAQALESIRSGGLLPIRATSASSSSAAMRFLSTDLSLSRPKLETRVAYAKMMAAMLQAGVPLDKAHRLLGADQSAKKTGKLSNVIAEQLASGSSYSTAVKNSQAGFADDEIGLLEAGEQTGALAPVLEELQDLLERRAALRSRIISASIYPCVLLLMTLATLVVILTVLVPSLTPVFAQSGQEPPLLLGLSITVARIMTTYWQLLIAIIVAGALLVFFASRQPIFKRGVDRLKFSFNIPRQLETARLCRTLGTLLHHNVSMQRAIPLTAKAVSGASTRQQLLEVSERVAAGKPLSVALAGVKVIDKTSLQMVGIGEETNKLDDILLHIATSKEANATSGIERWMTLLTPVMTVLLGALVGSIMLGVMRAILSINQAVVQ